jgi:hypothetical protein
MVENVTQCRHPLRYSYDISPHSKFFMEEHAYFFQSAQWNYLVKP